MSGPIVDEHAMRLVAVTFDAKTNAFDLRLSGDIVVRVSLGRLQEFEGAEPAELRAVYAGCGGASISQDDLDIDISVIGLLDDLFGKEIRAERGRRSGMQTSAAKAAAARRNGRKGGRPKKKQAARRAR